MWEHGGVGSRRILKSARIQPLEIRWETVIGFPLVTLYLGWKIMVGALIENESVE